MPKEYSDRDQHNTHGESLEQSIANEAALRAGLRGPDNVVDLPEPPVQDEKYITIKREDLPKLIADLKVELTPNFAKHIERYAVQDAVVIRRQDIFSPAPMEMYADGVGVAIAVLKKVLEMLPQSAVKAEIWRMMDGLSVQADYMHAQAEQARQDGGKLPD